MNKKIAIVTWYNSINYGTCLQCFALVSFLNKQGYEAFVPQNYRFYYNLFNISEWYNLILAKFLRKKTNPIIDDFFKIRKLNNSNFTNKYCNILPIKTKKDFQNMLKITDIFITGSDQIWNPFHLQTPFLLSFVPKNKKKIAYSSSIGVNEIPKHKIKFYKKYLSRFNHIAVREQSAQTLLQKLLNKPIEWVLDPVFLLELDEWKKLFKSNEEIGFKEHEYIFCYFVGNNNKWVNEIKNISQKLNLPVKIAVSESKMMPDIGECLPDMGVEDFISCINNAKYVVTDSFHATALSIIFNKNFGVYKRFNDEEVVSQNSRIFSLLKMFNLESRLVENNNSIDTILNKEILYDNVNNVLKEKISHSVNYIINAIEE